MKINKTWIGVQILFVGGAITLFGAFVQQEKYDTGYFIALLGVLIGIAGCIFHAKQTLTGKEQ